MPRKKLSSAEKFLRKTLGPRGRRKPTFDEKIVAVCEKAVDMTRDEKIIHLRQLKKSLWKTFLESERYARTTDVIEDTSFPDERTYFFPNFPFFICPVCGNEQYKQHKVPDSTNPRNILYGGDVVHYPGSCTCSECETCFKNPVSYAYHGGKNPYVFPTATKTTRKKSASKSS